MSDTTRITIEQFRRAMRMAFNEGTQLPMLQESAAAGRATVDWEAGVRETLDEIERRVLYWEPDDLPKQG